METLYRIATDADLEALRHSGRLTVNVTYPTIIAARQGVKEALAWTDQDAIVGFIGTHDRKDTVMAGPLEAINAFIARNLIELYENTLRHAGLSMYWFHVKPGTWAEAVERAPNVTKIHEMADGSTIYRRSL